MANAPLDRVEGTLLALFNMTDPDGRILEYSAVYVRPFEVTASEPEGETVIVITRCNTHPDGYEQHWHYYGENARTHAINKCLSQGGFPTIRDEDI